MKPSRKTHLLLTITHIEGEFEHVKIGNVINFHGADSLSVFDSKEIESKIIEKVTIQVGEGKSSPAQIITRGCRIDIFIEILPPEIHVILMGHQYDVYPVSRLLKELDWRVSICGDVFKINSQIKSFSNEIVSDLEFTKLIIDEHTAVILMSHDYKTDKRNLRRVLLTQASFIGMLGPRVRSEKIWEELAEEGKKIIKADMNRIHAPVGLDIGAVTPEEIALSLAAGIKAAFSKRDGRFLKLRETPIHPRS